MRVVKEKLREDITVAWPESVIYWSPTRSRKWFVTRVTTHCVPDDLLGPRYATYTELVSSAMRDDVFAVFADSKEEALMKYAASGRIPRRRGVVGGIRSSAGLARRPHRAGRAQVHADEGGHVNGHRKEPREDLAVVWQDFDSGDWVVTHVTSYKAQEDASAPKCVTGCELVGSRIFSSNVIKAGSKHEALMKYAVAGHAGNIWSIADDEAVLYRFLSPMERNTIYNLVKEDF